MTSSLWRVPPDARGRTAFDDEPRTSPNRWKRFSDWDERFLRLDKFATEVADHGFVAFAHPNDPKPAVSFANGRVESMDAVAVRDFAHATGLRNHT
ncbi:propanediol/glycerol family dehydratase large subunit [Hyphomicrobium sp.]|uniref:propanediol/glycerol family dehydratase large subunit n=1 Tax=Hyphomicrobium sp. TaxID=82 RepID=UPI001E1221B0|nr:propanediol/glycerol family dehydratase large subunit [Hyphomicrobium sp.]MBY0558541.1 hypothetical protein [Hyphomicrobium sp.]